MDNMEGDNVQYDVDMIKIRNLRPQWLPFLAYGLVDLAGREPYVKKFQISQEDLGFCIVSAPIYVFIDRMKRVNFTEALADSVRERFLHLSGERCKFLHSGPRKCHIEHVMEALSRADIQFVNVYTYGMKSAPQHFLFLDDTNAEAAVEVDFGFHIRGKPGHLGLVRPMPGSSFPNGTVGKFPMLASVQRKRVSDLFGTFCWTAYPLSNLTVRKVKVYSGLVHLLKSFGRDSNFGILPKNGMMFKSRVSQGREFLWWARRCPQFLEHACKIRVEVTVRKDCSMMGLLYAVGSIGLGYIDLIETLEVPFPVYLGEAERVLNLGSQSSQTMIRSKRAEGTPSGRPHLGGTHAECLRAFHCRHRRVSRGGGPRRSILLGTR